MRIEVTRSGGFAGIAKRAAVDPASPEIEALARAAEHEPIANDATPDAFEYRVTIDGRSSVVRNPRGAWKRLIDSVEDWESPAG